ncbi:MAG: alanyl-tRNA editing protein [Alphaproteobacteria bacterium RIFCSPHIGHO2_01_FULL_41_14]|nr:MAG: alanyl-tRNA editing protein [Alphaproteobacteria bacterium GWB1_45_5]OFW76495.1 MAG: alanyl-tRNA editing protein [Alphaproteobacteria bacterium GWA1_45_9]OFW89617.1 MAG: alanyl-tRNA editing protein [Alphaproteobacteria bacterium RIFCSPHIGHO2_01_FULL_41_14]HCI48404.1 alanyl-tRNA editing protein [Holosporales bacterium]
MKKVFWINPYQASLDTKIVSVTGNEVLLEETIAFSFSGGQESDRATLNGLEILGSRMEGTRIYYTVGENHPFTAGLAVQMAIDWPRRYRLMRLHFAAELILELVTRKFQLEKLGAHISETKARIDFRLETNISAIFEDLLTEFNKIIEKDYPILTDFSDRDTQRRFWKIEGFAEVPCGGTHVKSTKEVGFVSLKRVRPGKSLERIEIRLVEDNVS